jgi:hypothetical protein
MTREEFKDRLFLIGGILFFGSALIMIMGWIANMTWPVLPWTLLVGAVAFGAAFLWDQLENRPRVTITHDISDDIKRDEDMRRVA